MQGYVSKIWNLKEIIFYLKGQLRRLLCLWKTLLFYVSFKFNYYILTFNLVFSLSQTLQRADYQYSFCANL